MAVSEKRILVTGSRDWDDVSVIHEALAAAYAYLEPEGTNSVTLVSGNCPTGADRIAEEFWLSFNNKRDLVLELHPADWHQYGKRAGFIRNAEMVELGASVCLAFIKNRSKGASMTSDLAEKHGILTVRFER